MKNNIKLIMGIVLGILIGGVTVVGANQFIQAIQNDQVIIKLNGKVQIFTDETTSERQYPLTYQDRTYLPLRNIAKLSGLTVGCDNNTNTIILNNENNFETIFKNVVEYEAQTGSFGSIRKIWLDGKILFVCCSGEGTTHLIIYDENGAVMYEGNGDFGESDIYLEGNKYYFYEYNSNGNQEVKEKVYLNFKNGRIDVYKETSSTHDTSTSNNSSNSSTNTSTNKVESTSETIARFIKSYNNLSPDYMISEISNPYGTSITFTKDGISIKVSYTDGKIQAIVTENTWIVDGVRKDMLKNVPTKYKDVIYNLARVGNEDLPKKTFDEIYSDLENGKYGSSLINNELELDGVYISYYNQRDFFSTTIEMEF